MLPPPQPAAGCGTETISGIRLQVATVLDRRMPLHEAANGPLETSDTVHAPTKKLLNVHVDHIGGADGG